MKHFQRNIGARGRLVRGLLGGALALAALGNLGRPLLAGFLAAAAVFALFEAGRGWCALRACGIKTRI